MSSDEAQAFSLVDMQTAFYILFIGLAVSTLVFIGELIVYKHKKFVPFEFVHWSKSEYDVLWRDIEFNWN